MTAKPTYLIDDKGQPHPYWEQNGVYIPYQPLPDLLTLLKRLNLGFVFTIQIPKDGVTHAAI